MIDEYWAVNLRAFAFDTEKDALRFRHALEDAFCAMPEAENIAGRFTVSKVASPTTEGE